MKKAILAAATALAAMAVAPAANAAINIPLTLIGGVYTGGFTITHSNGSFVDVFTFGPVAAGTNDVSLITIASQPAANLDFTGGDLDGNALTFSPTGSLEGGALVKLLAGGLHTLTVTGNVTGSLATYSGTVNVYPAVPEPASWAMMIAGIAAVGTAMRRRAHTARVAFS